MRLALDTNSYTDLCRGVPQVVEHCLANLVEGTDVGHIDRLQFGIPQTDSGWTSLKEAEVSSGFFPGSSWVSAFLHRAQLTLWFLAHRMNWAY